MSIREGVSYMEGTEKLDDLLNSCGFLVACLRWNAYWLELFRASPVQIRLMDAKKGTGD